MANPPKKPPQNPWYIGPSAPIRRPRLEGAPRLPTPPKDLEPFIAAMAAPRRGSLLETAPPLIPPPWRAALASLPPVPTASWHPPMAPPVPTALPLGTWHAPMALPVQASKFARSSSIDPGKANILAGLAYDLTVPEAAKATDKIFDTHFHPFAEAGGKFFPLIGGGMTLRENLEKGYPADASFAGAVASEGVPMAVGAATGAAAGTLGGPAAPLLVPLGALGGALTSYFGGDKINDATIKGVEYLKKHYRAVPNRDKKYPDWNQAVTLIVH